MSDPHISEFWFANIQRKMPPDIDMRFIPDGEKPSTDHVTSNLSAMDSYIWEYYSLLSLYRFCNKAAEIAREASFAARKARPLDFDERLQRRAQMQHGWPFAAARECAMAAYHFARACEGINKSLGGCPTIRNYADLSALKEGNRLFNKIFPGFVAMREGISHAQEARNSPIASSEHEVKGPITLPGMEVGGALSINGMLSGDTYKTTWEGKVVEFSMNEATGKALEEIRDAFYLAFVPVSEMTRKLRKE
jgi:hypothetical protein